MAVITLTFPNPLNVSVQVGDTAYYCNTTFVGRHATAKQSDIIEIGEIKTIPDRFTIVCDMDATTIPPTTSSFIMFSKDNKANLSSILGYYAEVKLVNDSTSEAELFTLACDFSESSK